MFILATMLIAVYIVTMTSTLMNLGAERIEFDRETLREPYLDSKREIQHYLELILADYTTNGTTITTNIAINRIEEFLTKMEIISSARGVVSQFQLNNDNFNLTAKRPPYENTSGLVGTVYISQIYAEFNLKMSAVSSSITIDESFSITFVSRAEIEGNSVIIQQSKGNQFDYIEAATIYIFDGSNYHIPSINPDHTGIYFFDDVTDLDNLGILNITLMNGVRIFS
jgi:hypothetical protein